VTDFDIDQSGTVDIRASLDDLEDKWSDAPTFEVGTGVEYAVYLEFGTEKMPPYPFFRPAIREFKANPERFVTSNSEYTDIEQIPNVNQLVRAIATALVSQMEKNASAASSTDRSPGVDPEHPMRDTGNLVNSISFQRIS